jgi:hypothetical protein
VPYFDPSSHIDVPRDSLSRCTRLRNLGCMPSTPPNGKNVYHIDYVLASRMFVLNICASDSKAYIRVEHPPEMPFHVPYFPSCNGGRHKKLSEKSLLVLVSCVSHFPFYLSRWGSSVQQNSLCPKWPPYSFQGWVVWMLWRQRQKQRRHQSHCLQARVTTPAEGPEHSSSHVCHELGSCPYAWNWGLAYRFLLPPPLESHPLAAKLFRKTKYPDQREQKVSSEQLATLRFSI